MEDILAFIKAKYEQHRSIKRSFAVGYYGAYNRLKFMLKKANIKDAAVHTLRKTAGAIYYKTNRDILPPVNF